MSRIQSSAPGKLVLAGEYAVLDGAPAIAMALNRRALVTLDDADDLHVRCKGLGGKTDTRVFDAVRDALQLDTWCGSVCLDTGAFTDTETGNKLGIGSSAALAVALTRALAPTHIGKDDLLRLACAAHRSLQQGQGSGVDVATSAWGGLIEYRVGDTPERLEWPDGLHYALLWSGVPASTSAQLARLSQSESSPSRDALAGSATRLAAAWATADADAVLEAYRDYVPALWRFDVDHRLGIFDAGHDELANVRSPTKLIYKPCGAGGGDVGIVLGTAEEAVRGFAREAERLGFRELGMSMDFDGAMLDRVGR